MINIFFTFPSHCHDHHRNITSASALQKFHRPSLSSVQFFTLCTYLLHRHRSTHVASHKLISHIIIDGYNHQKNNFQQFFSARILYNHVSWKFSHLLTPCARVTVNCIFIVCFNNVTPATTLCLPVDYLLCLRRRSPSHNPPMPILLNPLSLLYYYQIRPQAVRPPSRTMTQDTSASPHPYCSLNMMAPPHLWKCQIPCSHWLSKLPEPIFATSCGSDFNFVQINHKRVRKEFP